MQSLFNFRKARACSPVPIHQLGGLSTEELQIRRSRARQMLALVGMLMASVVGMAIWSELYPLILTSVAMFPAFDEQLKKLRAIQKHLP